MTSKNTLIIGTRGSALALAQADMVCAALSLRYPELDVRREIIHTIGDRRTDVPLADVARVSGMVDKGIFIKELETALRDGRIDVAVHSLKDVPSELAAGFTLAAVLPRAAVEDVLITKEPDWNGSGTLATGSVRRRLMARTYWGSGLRFENLRGNVPTRLGKLVEHPGWDAVILARAGLERLGLYAPETLVKEENFTCVPCRWKFLFLLWGRASLEWNAVPRTGRRRKCWKASMIRNLLPVRWRNGLSWYVWVRTVPRPWVFTPIRMERNWFCGLRITFRAGKSLLPL